MPAVTRVGDDTVGVCNIGLPCCPHGRNGVNTTGSPNIYVNGIPVHRISDIGDCRCPHGGSYQSITGSSSVFFNGIPVTRVGDITQCMACGQTGTHVSGSGNVFVGG